MAASEHDVAHLVALIGAAEAEAERLGPVGGMVRERLRQAKTQARAIQQRGGEADQGLRLEELTTDNDQ